MSNIFILGKVNTGKTFTFNKLLSLKNLSLNQKHTTVDLIIKPFEILDLNYELVDTPGFETIKEFNQVFERIKKIINSKNVLLYFINDSFDQIDKTIIKNIKDKFYKIYLICNNLEDLQNIPHTLFSKIYEKNSFSFECLIKIIKEINYAGLKKTQTTNICLYGKENTGKSTLFNKISKINLSKVKNELHTTRDTVVWKTKFKNNYYQISDTAGLIKSNSTRSNKTIELNSISQTIKSIYSSDIIVLVLDCNNESKFDFKLIGEVMKFKKNFIIFINKIDKIDNINQFKINFHKYLKSNHNKFKYLKFYFVSALKDSSYKLMNNIVMNISNQETIFKTSYLKKIGNLINLDLYNLTINQKNVKILFIRHLKEKNLDIFFVITNLKKRIIPKNIKTFIEKNLIENLNLKGIPFKVNFD